MMGGALIFLALVASAIFICLRKNDLSFSDFKKILKNIKRLKSKVTENDEERISLDEPERTTLLRGSNQEEDEESNQLKTVVVRKVSAQGPVDINVSANEIIELREDVSI